MVNGSKTATDGFQMYFTSDSNIVANITSWEQYLAMLPLPAQVTYKNGIIADTSNWVNIQGSFWANGGEKFVYIGCFKDTLNINGVDVPNDPNNS